MASGTRHGVEMRGAVSRRGGRRGVKGREVARHRDEGGAASRLRGGAVVLRWGRRRGATVGDKGGHDEIGLSG